ncbi:MAG: DUF262 domain-containing protein [Desulfurobacteriaceae bacterium]
MDSKKQNEKIFDVELTEFPRLLEGNVLYLIPHYQRPYAWEKKQIEDFFFDIKNVSERDIRNYIFGTVFLAEVALDELKNFVNKKVYQQIKNLENERTKFYLIIDGQQRLTTLWLFLFAMLRKLKGMGKESEIKKKLFVEDSEPRIFLGSPIDYDFLKELANAKNIEKLCPKTYSQELMRRAFCYFIENLANHSSSRLYESLENLKVIKTVINVRELTKKEEETAFSELINIFVSQTDRGKRLTALEKLKSLMIYYANLLFGEEVRNEKNNDINELFADIYELLESLTSERFMVFKSAKEAEATTMHLLNLLLYRSNAVSGKSFYRYVIDVIKKEKESSSLDGSIKYSIDIWYESGEDTIYQAINKAFRDLINYDLKSEAKKLFSVLYESLKEIKQYYSTLKESITNVEKSGIDILSNELSYSVREFLGIYGASRFTHYIALNLNSELKFNKTFDVEEEQKFLLEERKKKLGLVSFKERLEKRIDYLKKKFKDSAEFLEEYLKHESSCLKEFLTERAYILNILEFSEMFVWKLGKRPWGGLFNFSNHLKEGKYRFISSQSNKCYRKDFYKYPIYDFREDYFYVLAEFERINFDYDKSSFEKNILKPLSKRPRGLQREHLFSVNSQEKDLLKEAFKRIERDFYKNDLPYSLEEEKERDWDYEKWVNNIGNIFLVESKLNISEGNRSIFDKAETYEKKTGENYPDIKGTKDFAKKIIGLKNKLKNELKLRDEFRSFKELEQILEQRGVREDYLYIVEAFKLLVDIRYYKILMFFACRF